MSARAQNDEGTTRRVGAVLGALLAALTATPILLLAAPAAAAPGAVNACPESTDDRSEPGDDVTVVGYTAGCLPPADVAAAAAGRPPTIVGYLYADPCVDVDLPYCTDPDPDPDAAAAATPAAHGTILGYFTLSPDTDPERGQRMELRFELPAGLTSGLYYLVVCREPCAAAGTTVDAAGATPLYVGVDPPPGGKPIRAWPLDDPAVATLPDDALVSPAAGRTMTGAEARAATRSGSGSSEATGTTDVVVADSLDTAAAATDDAPPWRPPAWWPFPLAALLAAGIGVIAARRRPARDAAVASSGDDPAFGPAPDRRPAPDLVRSGRTGPIGLVEPHRPSTAPAISRRTTDLAAAGGSLVDIGLLRRTGTGTGTGAGAERDVRGRRRRGRKRVRPAGDPDRQHT